MPRSEVPVVKLERLPHRHAIIRLRQAYQRLSQLKVEPKAEQKQNKHIIQESTKCKK
jgi:hypothetical protein